MDMEIIAKVCTYRFYYNKKTPFKLQKNSMFYGNEIKIAKSNLWFIQK
jgi:hypothetical protein